MARTLRLGGLAAVVLMAGCLETRVGDQAGDTDIDSTQRSLTMSSRGQVDQATLHANYGGTAYARQGTSYDGDDNTGRVSWKQGGYTATSAGQVSTCTYGWCGWPSVGSGCVSGDDDESAWGYSYGACNSSAWGQRFGGYIDDVDRPAGSGDKVHSNYEAGVSGTTTFGYHPYWSVLYNGECRTYQGWSYADHGCSGTQYIVDDPSVCGDGTCQDDETCGSCAADCGACPYCGDGVCNGADTCGNCENDCGACPPGLHEENLSGGVINREMFVPAGATDIVIAINGGSGDADLYVRFGAAPTTSTYDCRPYANGNNETCTGSQTGGTYYVMINPYSSYSGLTLDGSFSESTGPVCGNGSCESGEDCGSCAADCGQCGPVCGNGTCESGEDCSSCAADCGSCGPVCGNGTCESGEDCSSCSADCGSCGPVCGNGTCESGEDCSSCSADCGSCGGGTCGGIYYSASGTSSASYTDADTVQYDIEMTAGTTYTISTCGGGSTDTYLRLHRAGSQVASNDDACGTQSRITYSASTTGTYVLSLGCYSSYSCSATVSVSPDSTCTETGSGDGGGGGGMCTNTCSYANDGWCDDGGPGSSYSVCGLGTDCGDCGPR